MTAISVPDHNYKTCGCKFCRERIGIAILTAAVKSMDMTGKQILAACRPRPLYYNAMTKWSRRACLWCPWNTCHYDYYG